MNTTKVAGLISLKGKVAAVTGAASGIGLATAKQLAEMGATTALLDINESGGERAAKEIKDAGGNAKFYTCDVTSNADCKRVTENIYTEFGSINILVNCAGVIIRKDVAELTEEEWDFVLGVDFKAVYLLSHHVIPYMKKSGGSIINVGFSFFLVLLFSCRFSSSDPCICYPSLLLSLNRHT